MRYRQTEFTLELQEKIQDMEAKLAAYAKQIQERHQADFEKKGLYFETELKKSAGHPFNPGYESVILLGAGLNKTEEFELHIIPIWKCDRIFMGMPVVRQIPGSQIYGELAEEQIGHIKEEIDGHVEELQDWLYTL